MTGETMKAVRFDDYGGIDVLQVRDVARPGPGPGQVLVAVRAAGINIGEAKIRTGLVREIFPATFPSGEGSDLAGVVEEVGAAVNGVAVGDEVIGWTDNRASHAEYVIVESANLTAKPAEVPWEVAGARMTRGIRPPRASRRPADVHDHIGAVVQGGGMGLPHRRTREWHGVKAGERRIRRGMKLALDDVLDRLGRNRRRRVLQLAQLGPVVR
jgi:hypothetical protein